MFNTQKLKIMTTIKERYEAVRKDEIRELKNALESVGGKFYFTDEEMEFQHGGEEPVIACNISKDFSIISAEIISDGNVQLNGYDLNGHGETISITPNDVKYGDLQTVTDAIVNNREKRVNFHFTAVISITGKNYEEIEAKWEQLQIFSDAALRYGADFCDTTYVEDGYTYQELPF